MTRSRFYGYLSIAFSLGMGAAALMCIHFAPERPEKEHLWLNKPEHTAIIDNVKCYYWHNPHPYNGKKRFKACEIHKR